MHRSIPLSSAAAIAFVLLLPACTSTPDKPEFIVPPGAEFASDLFSYSQAVRTGSWVTVSGQVGIDAETHRFPDDFKEQVRLSFKNLETVLKASGASLDEVVEVTTYQLDMSLFPDVVDIHNEVFGEHRPAWTVLGVNALALPSVQFEVSVRAWSPVRKTAPASK
ncbi:MAG: RidA family protein [Nevskia sp.]